MPQQTVAGQVGEAAGLRRLLQEGFADPPVGELPAQGRDQLAVPAGMDHAEAPGIEEQRQLLEPAEEVAPVGVVALELLEGLLDQPGMPRRMLADVLAAAAGRRRGAPAERVEFVVAHDAQRLAGVDHRVHPVQGLADARAAVDDVAEEQRLAPRMAPDAALQAVAEQVEEAVQGMRAAVDIADQVVATSGVELHQSPPPRRLPQPSLVRQIS